MVKNGKIGFALVGTGMAGQTHARELEFVEDAELVAVLIGVTTPLTAPLLT